MGVSRFDSEDDLLVSVAAESWVPVAGAPGYYSHPEHPWLGWSVVRAPVFDFYVVPFTRRDFVWRGLPAPVLALRAAALAAAAPVPCRCCGGSGWAGGGVGR